MTKLHILGGLALGIAIPFTALQLAGLQPAGQVAGRTLVFRASFGTVATDLETLIARPPADSMVAAGIG